MRGEYIDLGPVQGRKVTATMAAQVMVTPVSHGEALTSLDRGRGHSRHIIGILGTFFIFLATSFCHPGIQLLLEASKHIFTALKLFIRFPLKVICLMHPMMMTILHLSIGGQHVTGLR